MTICPWNFFKKFKAVFFITLRCFTPGYKNITYKILFNDAVAMTGGQPVDGVLTVPQISFQVLAEGASEVLIVSDEPEKYANQNDNTFQLPAEVKVYHRDELEKLQLRLRDQSGVSIIIYDQTCATEKRRRRKRGLMPDPARRAFINPSVCEGCGDCTEVSGCVSIEPLATDLGTKRQINQKIFKKFNCF